MFCCCVVSLIESVRVLCISIENAWRTELSQAIVPYTMRDVYVWYSSRTGTCYQTSKCCCSLSTTNDSRTTNVRINVPNRGETLAQGNTRWFGAAGGFRQPGSNNLSLRAVRIKQKKAEWSVKKSDALVTVHTRFTDYNTYAYSTRHLPKCKIPTKAPSKEPQCTHDERAFVDGTRCSRVREAGRGAHGGRGLLVLGGD